MIGAPTSVLVVGAGLAGSRCAETLRAEGFTGRIVLVGEEPLPPYERPALSKEFLAGRGDVDSLVLRASGFWSERGIVILPGRRVQRVDVANRTASLRGGKDLIWEALVLATGVEARRLPGAAAPAGVHVLRTAADALPLRASLLPGSRLAIVGAGFVGTEVASTARGLGVEVVLIDERLPLEGPLGPEVGRLLADRYREHGVELRLGRPVAGFETGRAERLYAVHLADGERVPCDAALVAVGVRPTPGLIPGIEAAGGGILTDACGRTAAPGVYACGDAAAAWRSWLGRPLRVEHWTGAAAQGAAVARAILGHDQPDPDLPYFWSDQFGLRLQHVGHAEGWARVELEGDPESFAVRYLDREGGLLAALVANRPREVGSLRRRLAAAQVALAA